MNVTPELVDDGLKKHFAPLPAKRQIIEDIEDG